MAHRGDPVRWLDAGSDAPGELRRVLSSAGGDGGGADALASLAAKLPLPLGAGSSVGTGGGAGGAAAAGATKKAILSWKLAAWIAGGTVAVGAASNLIALAPSRPAIVESAQVARAAAPPGSGSPPGPGPGEVAGAGAGAGADSTDGAGDHAGAGAVSSAGTGAVSNERAGVPSSDRSRASMPVGVSARARLAASAGPAASAASVTGAGRAVDTAGDDSLAAEAKLLLRAKAALVDHPQKALASADEHDAAFSGGALAEEREVIRIEALVRLDKRDEAARAAAAFRARHPQSSHLPRVERLVR